MSSVESVLGNKVSLADSVQLAAQDLLVNIDFEV